MLVEAEEELWRLGEGRREWGVGMREMKDEK